jgi:predicted DNA-binding transcriptional regulator YafY
VRLDYYSMQRGEQRTREVDPYHVTLFNGGLYLVGYCHVRKAVRIFAMERIRAPDVMRTRFTMPAGFDVQEYLKDAWGIVHGELVMVKVIFARSVARYIKERLWQPSQKVRQLDDGGVEITLRVADTVEVPSDAAAAVAVWCGGSAESRRPGGQGTT